MYHMIEKRKGTVMNHREESQWKIVRNRSCIRALLIFLGVVLMQIAAYMLCILLLVLGAYAFRSDVLLRMVADANKQKMSGDFLVLLSGISALLSAVWCGILYKKSQWREQNFDYRQAFSLKNIAALAGTAMGSCIVITMVLSFLSALAPQYFEEYEGVMEHLTKSSVLLSTGYVLLLGPVSEELIFRGAILDRFYLAFPYWVANLLQAALFGLYHMNVVQGIYAFMLGMMLGMIRYVTKSILPAMAAHILFNATSYLLGIIFPEGKDIAAGQMIFVLLFGILFACTGLWYYIKKYKEQSRAQG